MCEWLAIWVDRLSWQVFAAVQEVSSKMKMNMSLEAAPRCAKQLLLLGTSLSFIEWIRAYGQTDQGEIESKPWRNSTFGAFTCGMSRVQNVQNSQQNSERDVHVFRICTLGKLPSSQIIRSRCYQVPLLCSKDSSQAKRFQNVLCPSETEKIRKPTATAQGKSRVIPVLCAVQLAVAAHKRP